MNCHKVQGAFSDYLDGAVNGREMQQIAAHLERCSACAEEFEAWRGVQQALAGASRVQVPADLGLRLRLAISHESAVRQGRRQIQLAARWENIWRPALMQYSAGLAGALVLIGSIGMLVGMVAVPQAVMANDEPLGAMTVPHYMYSAAELQPVITAADATIVVEANVNDRGEVYDYSIVSGPLDEATRIQVRDQLLLQVYEPARVFGEPVRGRVLITFAGVSVKG